MTLESISKRINSTAHAKGWYDEGPREFGLALALMHSELSEALEAWRKGEPGDWHDESKAINGVPKPEGHANELVGCVIRILDTLYEDGFDVDELLRNNLDYNDQRPYRHGGKRA